jgi:hypothetical protein
VAGLRKATEVEVELVHGEAARLDLRGPGPPVADALAVEGVFGVPLHAGGDESEQAIADANDRRMVELGLPAKARHADAVHERAVAGALVAHEPRAVAVRNRGVGAGDGRAVDAHVPGRTAAHEHDGAPERVCRGGARRTVDDYEPSGGLERVAARRGWREPGPH